MPNKRLTIVGNYQAAAASGVGGTADYIDIDITPDGLNLGDLGSGPTRDSIAVPITILDSAGNVVDWLICTGWQASPPRLFIDPRYASAIPGPCTVVCSPNLPVMACYQSAQSLSGSINGSTYIAEHGLTHEVTVNGAGTISLKSSMQNTASPFKGYNQAFNAGHKTRLIVVDGPGTQPAITWSHDAGAIRWESGAPQFVAGKPRMVVEVVGNNGILFGWFRLFA